MGRLPVNLDSPFHQKACVAGSVVLGSAVGAFAGMGIMTIPYAIAGAATGFIIGEVICTWGPIDRIFRDKLDFESGINDFQSSNEAVSFAIDKLAAVPTVKSRDEAALILRFTLNTALADTGTYWKLANERHGTRMTGCDLHGVTTLANTAAQILAAQKA